MQVAIHFGTHGTEPERMIRTLMENRDWLLANGVEVVPPGRYKGVLDEALNSLKGGEAPPRMEEVIYDALLEADNVQRMVLSQASLIGAPVLVAALAALRSLAPTHLASAGAAAGALAGGAGAAVYALHCPEVGAPFLAVWYVAGIALSTLLGTLLGPRWLRW